MLLARRLTIAVLSGLALGSVTVVAGAAPPRPASSGGSAGAAACGINTAFVCLEGGKTKLTFRAQWLARVRRNGWRLVAIRPAVKRGNVLTMPIVKMGKLTLFRRSMLGGLSFMPPGGECTTDASLSTGGAIHHSGGFALLRRGVREPFDALALRSQAFYWRGADHREQGEKGPGSGTFGGVWSGSPRIDFPVSPNRGRTVISALRVNEVTSNRGPVLGVMGSADSRWMYDPYCEVVEPE